MAGLFEPPPKMVEQIRAWAWELYAEHCMAVANQLVAQYQPSGAGDPIQTAKEFRRTIQQDIDVLYQKGDGTLHIDLSYRKDPFVLDIVAEPEGIEVSLTTSKGQAQDRYGGPSDPDLIKSLKLMIDMRVRDLSSRIPSAEKPEGSRDNALVDAVLMRREVSKYTSKAKERKTKVVRKFDIDLTGWKYGDEVSRASGGERATTILSLGHGWHDITCVMNFDAHARRFGQWDPQKRELQIDVTIARPVTAKGFNNGLYELEKGIVHELRHFGQDALRVLKRLKEDAGLPSARAQGSPGSQHDLEHALRDVEFYTDLGDAIGEFVRFIPHITPKHRRQTAGAFIDDPNFRGFGLPNWFFQAIRKKAPDKWRKAVAEFWKAVEPRL